MTLAGATPARYTTRPHTVEAVRWTGGNHTDLREFAGDKLWFDPSGVPYAHTGPDHGHQRWALLMAGDWVLRWPGSDRELWLCPPGEFDATYVKTDVAQDEGPDDNDKSPKPAAKKQTKKATRKRSTKKAGGSP